MGSGNKLRSVSNSRSERNRERLLHCLVKGATEYAMVLIDPEERVTYWNAGAENMMGFTEAEMLGKPIYRIFVPEDVELKVAHKELQRARESGWADDERWHVRKDGTRFWASGVVTSVRGDDGELIGFSKVFRDQTLRKQTEERLLSSVAQMTQFNHAISHDLQEPLRMVSSYLALIDRLWGAGKVSADLDTYLSVARDGAKRLQALVTDLLAFVRSDPRLARREATDCAAIFDTAVSNLKMAIDESGAIVTRTSLPIVEGDPTQLVRLFQNLISNAIKYRRSDERPKVLVDANCAAHVWHFCICDNGIGVPEAERENVFEAFRRLHPSDAYPGTGLGLHLCRKIVEAHGGKIWIGDSSMQGAKVCFTLPDSPLKRS